MLQPANFTFATAAPKLTSTIEKWALYCWHLPQPRYSIVTLAPKPKEFGDPSSTRPVLLTAILLSNTMPFQISCAVPCHSKMALYEVIRDEI